jgi:membrane protease YdiL (CAAX protease family)
MIARMIPRPSSVVWARAGPLCLAVGVVLLAMARNLLAHSRSGDAVAIQLFGYGALVLVSMAAAHRAGLGVRQCGLGPDHLLRRLFGGLLLTAVLVAPGLLHGVSAPVALAALPGACAVAAVEELLFRGVLFSLWRQEAGAATAVILTSLAFAATHVFLYPPPILLLGVVVGLLFGSWRALADDLAAPIMAHTIADAVAMAMLGGLG